MEKHKAEKREELQEYLRPTGYIDSDHPDIVRKALELTKDCKTEEEKLERVYYFVRELPYDILNSFRYLAQGKRRASDVIHEGKAFCMGKASSFVALCRAAGIPARIGFQQLDCPDKPFFPEEIRQLWGDRKLPWHSLGEAYLNGKWLKLDATIDSAFAAAKGRKYEREFDGEHDIPTVEGPILKDLGSYPDYPREVGEWYEAMAKEVMQAMKSAEVRSKAAADDQLWAGPESGRVRPKSSR